MQSKVLELQNKVSKLKAEKEDLLSILKVLSNMYTINSDLHFHIQQKLDKYKE